MKHTVKIIALLLMMFLVTQLVGLIVLNLYSPKITQVVNENNETVNKTTYNLPYGMEPPEKVTPRTSLISILIAFIIAISLMLFLMKFRVTVFLRAWFFLVVI